MAPIRTVKQFLLAAMFVVVGTACSDLDPVKVESKCDGPGPIDERCPQCQIPQFASECPQCQQSSLDDGTCLPPGVAWTDPMTSESNVSTQAEGGVPDGEAGQTPADDPGAPDQPPGSGNNEPGNAGNPGKPGSSDAQPGSGSGGNGGSANNGGPNGQPVAGRNPGIQPPDACAGPEDCKKNPMYPACRGDGKCVECTATYPCANGMQCDVATNGCWECVNDEPCLPRGQVCFPEGRVCVTCTGEGVNCPPEAPACTPNHECVACIANKDCPVATPACSENTCVECNVSTDCTRDAKRSCIKEEHRCVECQGEPDCRGVTGRPHCFPDSNQCVECLEDADCLELSASHCNADTHSCEPCSSPTHCAQFAGTAPRCAASGCVACDRDGGICNGKACILSTNVCSDKNKQSVQACNECASSDECIVGHVCVATMFGSRSTGNRCLPNLADYKQAGKPCPRPFSRSVKNIDTVEAFHIDTLCSLPEATSCAALLDTLSSKVCNGDNYACGLGQYDGFCGMDGCTYNCDNTDFCPNNMTCSEQTKYCL